MMASDLKRRIKRDRRHRGYGYHAFLVLAGCILIGAGQFCITQAYTSLSQTRLFNASAAVNKAIQPPTVESASAAPAAPNAYANISLIAKTAIVYDLTNGQTLYVQNVYIPLPLSCLAQRGTAASVMCPN